MSTHIRPRCCGRYCPCVDDTERTNEGQLVRRSRTLVLLPPRQIQRRTITSRRQSPPIHNGVVRCVIEVRERGAGEFRARVNQDIGRLERMSTPHAEDEPISHSSRSSHGTSAGVSKSWKCSPFSLLRICSAAAPPSPAEMIACHSSGHTMAPVA